MSPVAASPISRRSRSYARVQAKLTVRPEESIPKNAGAAALHRLDNTIQVTKPVWHQLCGSDVLTDIQSSVPVAVVISQDSVQMHTFSEHTHKSLLNATVARAVLLTSSIDGHVAETTESEAFITSEFARTYLPSTSFENPVQITVQRTDLVVLDEIILAATTSEAYDILSSSGAG